MTFTVAPLHTQIAALLPRLRRLARTIACHRDEADDLVQCAVERALQRGPQSEAGTRLDTWIFRIMKNAWMDEVCLRIRRDRSGVPDDAGEHAADADAQARQGRLAIHKAVSLLSEDHRIVVGLVLVDGLPYKEAATVLAIPIGTLTSRLARAREALHALLSDQARNVS